jgi:hypothetical protein
MVQQTVSLNGTWNVVFDPQDIGKKRKYFAQIPAGKPVPVPGVWEQVKPLYDGVGWYHTAIAGRKEWKNKVVRLKFGAVNYFSEVWLNGQYLGAHEGGYTPFIFDISRQIRVGDNSLVVRVIDPPRDRTIEGLRTGAPLSQADTPTWKAGWYHNFGGIWQAVELIITEKTYVDDVFVEASCLKKRVKATITLVNKGNPRAVVLAINAVPAKNPADTLFTLKKTLRLKKGRSTVAIAKTLRKFIPWDCDNPHLYNLNVALKEKKEFLHTHMVRFGIRDFTIEGGHFMLNGKRIMLKGFLQQGVYPKTLVFPHDRAMAVREMKLLKDNGFNYMRAHLKPSPPIILDLADELGVLISGEPPMGWIERTAKTAGRCKNEVRELVQRDRNHPSVVFWCVFNEAYHYRTFTIKQVMTLTHAMMKIGRKLDPTRMILGNSGGMGEDPATEAYFPYGKSIRKMVDAHAYYGPSQHGLKRYRADGHKGLATYISEFGAFEAPMDYKKVLAAYTPAEQRLGIEDFAQYRSYYRSLAGIFQKAGLAGTFGSLDNYIRTIDRQRGYEADLMVRNIRTNPRYDGYALCQLADASGEIFGATDLWRRPKQIFRGYARASQTPLINPFVDPIVLKKGDRFAVDVRVANEHKLGERYQAVTAIQDPSGRTLRTFTKAYRARNWVDELRHEALTANWAPGKYTVESSLRQGRRVINTSTMNFTIIPEPIKKVDRVVLFDSGKSLLPAFKHLGYTCEEGNNNFRPKDRVNVATFNIDCDQWYIREVLGQMKRIILTGGVGLLLEPATPLLYSEILPRPIRRAFLMRDLYFIPDHPIFARLPRKCVMDYEYDGLLPNYTDNPDDILRLGGQVVCGSVSSHMWTTPDTYSWGAGISIVPLGRGRMIICHFPLLKNVEKNIVAQNLLVNLVNYAQTLIQPGYEDRLLNRCIDPIRL